jgi:hypothetical protein
MKQLTSHSRHFLTDLEPYVCIANECKQPTVTFALFQQWKDHMDSAHTPDWLEHLQRRKTWNCDVNPREDATFNSAAEFEQHVKSVHGDVVPSIVLATMLEQNASYTNRSILYCPFCGNTIDADDETVHQPELVEGDEGKVTEESRTLV